eukprot:NODE_597_length_6263_cov_0.206035.p3 type:complete len:281 gc:universal NODE_597_length_6263_cov_0.206035:3435-2593(-)
MSDLGQMIIDEAPGFLTVLIINWIVSITSLIYSALTWKTSNYNKFNAFAVLQFLFTSFGDLLLVIAMPAYDMNWGVANTTLLWSIGIFWQDAATFINNILLAYRLRVFKQVAKIPNWVEKSLYSFIVLIYVGFALVSNFLLFAMGASDNFLGLLLHNFFYIFYLINSLGIAVTSVILILKFNGQASKYQGTAGAETNSYKKRETKRVVIVLVTSATFLLIIGIMNMTITKIFPLTDTFAGLILRIVFMLHLWYNNVIKRIVLGNSKKKESAQSKAVKSVQ